MRRLFAVALVVALAACAGGTEPSTSEVKVRANEHITCPPGQTETQDAGGRWVCVPA